MPVSTAFAAPITAAPAISGSAANSRFTVSIASRKPLMIALPVTCTPATTTSQAAENHGAMASMAGFSIETRPSRITCQTASAVSPKPTVTPEASLISCRNPARATVLAITAAVATGCARATPSTRPAVCFNAALTPPWPA